MRELAEGLEFRARQPGQRRIRGEWLDWLGIRESQRVLEVGCGSGALTRAIAERVGKSGVVIGADPSAVLLEYAAALAEREGLAGRIRFQIGTAAEPGIQDGDCDVALAATVFTHLEEPQAGLRGLLRAVKAGGLVSVFDQDYETLVFDHADEVGTAAVVRGNARERVLNGTAGRQLFRWLVELGLEDVQVRTFSYAEAGRASYLPSLAERGAAAAVQAGWMSRERADHWLRDLYERDRRGVFFGALTYVAAWGRKPGSAED